MDKQEATLKAAKSVYEFGITVGSYMVQKTDELSEKKKQVIRRTTEELQDKVSSLLVWLYGAMEELDSIKGAQ